MYRFIVLYICIYVAPGTCEARHLVPLYVPTCSGMTIKLNLTWDTHTLRHTHTPVVSCLKTGLFFRFRAFNEVELTRWDSVAAESKQTVSCGNTENKTRLEGSVQHRNVSERLWSVASVVQKYTNWPVKRVLTSGASFIKHAYAQIWS